MDWRESWKKQAENAQPGDTIIINEPVYLCRGEKFPSKEGVTTIIKGPYISTYQIFTPDENAGISDWWGATSPSEPLSQKEYPSE